MHRLHGRDRDAAAAATEALEIYRADGPRRFRNRIDPDFDIQAAAAACCVVLAVVAADEGDEPERAATLLGQAERLRAEVGGAPVPARSRPDDVDTAPAVAALRAHRVAAPRVEPAAKPPVSGAHRMLEVVPQPCGPTPGGIS